LTLELVPGLPDGIVFAADPVVLGAPVAPTFNLTIPFASRQWVASEMVGAGEVPGTGAGWTLVCALAANTPAAINIVAPRTLVSMAAPSL
jgi:hypothetical protein